MQRHGNGLYDDECDTLRNAPHPPETKSPIGNRRRKGRSKRAKGDEFHTPSYSFYLSINLRGSSSWGHPLHALSKTSATLNGCSRCGEWNPVHRLTSDLFVLDQNGHVFRPFFRGTSCGILWKGRLPHKANNYADSCWHTHTNIHGKSRGCEAKRLLYHENQGARAAMAVTSRGGGKSKRQTSRRSGRISASFAIGRDGESEKEGEVHRRTDKLRGSVRETDRQSVRSHINHSSVRGKLPDVEPGMICFINVKEHRHVYSSLYVCVYIHIYMYICISACKCISQTSGETNRQREQR